MTELVLQSEGLVKDHVSDLKRKRLRVVDKLNLKILRNETYGMLGPNGAGKTTCVKLFLGLLKPTEGKVTVLGYPAGDRRALSRVGFLPENPYFYSYLTAREFLEFSAQLFGIPVGQRGARARELLELVSLMGDADRMLRKYSKGMLQRLGIAQALLNDPELLFLDEPQSGLDPIGRRDVRRILLKLKEEGKTIFFNSHLLPDVSEVCDRIGILNRGRLVGEGETRKIIAGGGYRDLEEYFLSTVCQSETREGAG